MTKDWIVKSLRELMVGENQWINQSFYFQSIRLTPKGLYPLSYNQVVRDDNLGGNAELFRPII